MTNEACSDPPLPVGLLTDGEMALLRAWADGIARVHVAAERERWELHLSATRKLAEANSKRGDDCGMLARTFLDTLKALEA